MNLTRQQFDAEISDPNFQAALQAKGYTPDDARRAFFRSTIAPTLKGRPMEERAQVLTDWGMVGPKTVKAREATNPLDAFASGFRHEAITNIPTAHVVNAGLHYAGADPLQDEENVYTNGLGNIIAGGLGTAAAQMADPLSILTGRAASLVGAPLATQAANGIIRGVSPAVSNAARALGSKTFNPGNAARAVGPRVAAKAVAPVRNMVLGGATGGVVGGVDAAAQQYANGEIDPWEVLKAAGTGAALGIGLAGLHAGVPSKTPRINEAPVVKKGIRSVRPVQDLALPPGNLTPEMKALSDQGYTFDQIQQILASRQNVATNPTARPDISMGPVRRDAATSQDPLALPPANLSPEIQQLSDAGYTVDQIQEVLAGHPPDMPYYEQAKAYLDSGAWAPNEVERWLQEQGPSHPDYHLIEAALRAHRAEGVRPSDNGFGPIVDEDGNIRGTGVPLPQGNGSVPTGRPAKPGVSSSANENWMQVSDQAPRTPAVKDTGANQSLDPSGMWAQVGKDIDGDFARAVQASGDNPAALLQTAQGYRQLALRVRDPQEQAYHQTLAEALHNKARQMLGTVDLGNEMPTPMKPTHPKPVKPSQGSQKPAEMSSTVPASSELSTGASKAVQAALKKAGANNDVLAEVALQYRVKAQKGGKQAPLHDEIATALEAEYKRRSNGANPTNGAVGGNAAAPVAQDPAAIASHAETLGQALDQLGTLYEVMNVLEPRDREFYDPAAHDAIVQAIEHVSNLRDGYKPSEMVSYRKAIELVNKMIPQPFGKFQNVWGLGRGGVRSDNIRESMVLKNAKNYHEQLAVADGDTRALLRDAISRGDTQGAVKAAKLLRDIHSISLVEAGLTDSSGEVSQVFRTLDLLKYPDKDRSNWWEKPDVSGDGMVEHNAGLNLRKAPEAFAQVHRQLSDLANKGAGKVTEAIAGAVNKVAGKDVLRGGYDPATGQDRLGNQAAEGYDWLLKEANTGGKVPLVDKALDAARFGLKSDHNLPADYAARKKMVDEEARAIKNKGTDLANNVKDNLTPEQDARLYDVLNDRTATNTDLAGTSEPIRQTLGDLGKQMHEHGVLTDAAYQANEGQYLKRLYRKHIDSAPEVVKLAKGLYSMAVKGSKFRGKKVSLSATAHDTFNKPWEVVREEGDSTIIKAGDETRTVPTKSVGDFVGDWKVLRKTKDGRITAWRDWTPDERAKMGEIKEASRAIVASMDAIARDLPRAKLLKDISNNSEWAIKEGAGDVPDGWVHFPEQKNQGGTQKWGALAGHYVEPNIARDLKLAEFYRSNQFFKSWRAVVHEVKKNWTSRNPASHGNNFFQNVFALEMNNGSVADLPEAVKVLREQGDLFKQFREAGLYDNVQGAVDLGMEMGGLKSPNVAETFKAFMQAIGKLDAKTAGSKALETVGAADKTLGRLYMGADDMFRTALVIGKMRQGLSLKEAVSQARERMYNPDTNAVGIMALRDSGVIPFVRAFHWSAAEVPKMALRNPGKVALLAAYWTAYKMWAGAAGGDTQEKQDARQALLPEYLQGPATTLPVPFKDTKGQRLMVDTKNWTPWNFLDTTEQGALPIPSALTPGGIWAPAYNTLTANYDPMGHKPIRNEYKPAADQVKDVTGYLFNAYGPAGLTRGLGRVINATTGNADSAGRRYDVPTALANLAGVKVQPFDDRQAILNAYRRGQHAEMEASMVLSDLKRQYQRGAIGLEEFRAKARQQMEIRQNIQKQSADLMRRAQVLNK